MYLKLIGHGILISIIAPIIWYGMLMLIIDYTGDYWMLDYSSDIIIVGLIILWVGISAKLYSMSDENELNKQIEKLES